jgi:hypothetical protein
MELTRRDAVLALAGGGVAVGAKAVAEGAAGDTAAGGAASLSDTDLETLVAAAEVLYPTSVGASREFVEAYATRRFADRAPAFELACMGHGTPLASDGDDALARLVERLAR